MTILKRRSRKDKSARPKKPRPDFPLFPHATRRWAKKVKGRLYYFGPWDDPEGALKKYLDQKDDLFAGRKPRPKADGFTIRELCNRFLTAKIRLRDNGELKSRTFTDYEGATNWIIEFFGRERLVEDVRADDFEQFRARLARGKKGKGWGPKTLDGVMNRIMIVFKYASDNQYISRPVCFGQGFRRPSQKMLRRARHARGPRMFEAAEILEMLNGTLVPGDRGPKLARAGVQLRAMILLGINCGFGNHDCGSLPLSALDLGRGWVNFPRPKTEVQRRCPLWPETVQALKEALTKRPAPKDEAASNLVFITKYGESWAKDVADSPITKETRKLLDALSINGHRNFYALRHTFETIGGETDRQTAVDFMMGHAPHANDMSAIYRERIGDDRLRAVTDHVRAWLFGSTASANGLAGVAKQGQEEE
jgi:integrase